MNRYPLFMNQIQSSNDFYPFSSIANFIFGGINNHIAHHLFPHISHYQYSKVNRILFDMLLKEDIIPNQTTYLGGIISHVKLLKIRGVEKEPVPRVSAL
jgi:linoleoyl-CoA desaturase